MHRASAGPTVPEKAYLTESSLGRFLRERLDPDIVSDLVIPGLAQRFRPDFRSESHKLIVEFDGDQHYQRAGRVLGDASRDAVFAGAGYEVIRIPYFVQLTEPVIGLLFGELVKNCSPWKDFPHGFVDERVIFPADFCEIGVARFREDLSRFGSIRADIERSLERACVIKDDWRLVYPPSLYPGRITSDPVRRDTKS
jgi:hypothetical protein